MTLEIERLCKALGYTFRDESLLTAALTHRSVGQNNNERLEFLGDAILGMVIAEELFKRHPGSPEGELSRMRANLVKGETLASLSRNLSLGDCLNLGPGELKSGGFRRNSILADAFEAILGAVYLDSDMQTVKRLILEQLSDKLDKVTPDVDKDPKTRLQEYMQSKQMPLPVYEVVDTQGKAHAQVFTVECNVEGQATVSASGSSRRKAEQAAAKILLDELEAETNG